MSAACEICLCGVSPDDSFTLDICYHVFCHKCLHDYLQGNLRLTIKCPEELCEENISDDIIRKCLSNQQTIIYDTLSVLLSSDDVRKCLTKDCPQVFPVDSDEIIFQCNYCEQPNCLMCQKRHYPNDCGRDDLNEIDIEDSANKVLRRRKREALEELLNSDEYIESPEAFVCELCCDFILPKNGIILRKCLHNFCKNCFEGILKCVRNIDMLKCPSCETEIDDREGIGAIELKDMICKQAAPKLYSCKTPDCKGLWDSNNSKSRFICPICKHENCLECEDIHEGMACRDFRQTMRYKNAQVITNTTKGSVKCKCGQLLILQRGCAALKCPNCLLNICVFTGKIAGDNGPSSCECTPEKLCHPGCVFGCRFD